MNKLNIMLAEMEEKEESRQQMTLSAPQDHPEVREWLVEKYRLETYTDFEKLVARAGVVELSKSCLMWTGQKLTYPQIKRIALDILKEPNMEVLR